MDKILYATDEADVSDAERLALDKSFDLGRRTALPRKTIGMFQTAFERHPDFDFYIKTDDDT